MSCYHPNLIQFIGIESKDKVMHPEKHLGAIVKPMSRFIKFKDASEDMLVNSEAYGLRKIPCGKCLGCRLDYSRNWADRMMLELETMKKAVFVTLTYNNAHIPYKLIKLEDGEEVPIGYTFCKRDVQLFMKNLRRDYEGVKIRFYLAAERGETTLRPHYHAIIFGIGIDDFPDRIPKGVNELGQQYYIVPELEKCWHEFDEKKNDLGSRGFVLASDVSYATCAYVARYVTKKAVPVSNIDELEGLDDEFNLMSRRPGIGMQYLADHPECLHFGNISVSTPEGAKKMRIPNYFLRVTELTDPLLVSKIRSDREKLANDTFYNKLIHTSLGYIDQLEVEEESKLRQISSIKHRNF